VRTIDSVAALKALEGQELGSSDWIRIDQDRIQAFADATGDHQWIHLDVERARRETPWGTTIAHGFLTLSLLPMLSQQIYQVNGVKSRINYGLDRVRFTNPVPAGSRVRLHLTLKSVEETAPGRWQVRSEARIELEGSERPACVAETIGLMLT